MIPMLILTLGLSICPPAFAQEPDLGNMSVQELQAQAPKLHPAGLYVLATRLLSRGERQEAAKWMYAGQLRYRFLLMAKGEKDSNDMVLFSALHERVGRPVNEYIGGNVDEWMAAIQAALDWDAANDNAVTSKERHARELAELRRGLSELRASLDGRREEIARTRTANGLENR